MNKKLKDLLIRSLDDELGSNERAELEEALVVSPELRQEKEQLLAMRMRIGGQQFAFQSGFSGRVMQQIGQISKGKVVMFDFTQGLAAAFKRIALSGAAAILMLLLYTYVKDGSLSVDSLLGLKELNSDNAITFAIHDFK